MRTCRKCDQPATNVSGPPVCDSCRVERRKGTKRRCSKCRRMKYPDHFSRSSNASVWCKQCCAENAARWRDNNRERVRRHDRDRSAKRRSDPAYAEWMRLYRLLTKYGLTAEDFEALWEAQGGRCAGCGGCFGRGRDGLHVDHDHATGQVRGLLCSACNTALGLCRDDVERLRRLADYLERPPGPAILLATRQNAVRQEAVVVAGED